MFQCLVIHNPYSLSIFHILHSYSIMGYLTFRRRMLLICLFFICSIVLVEGFSVPRNVLHKRAQLSPTLSHTQRSHCYQRYAHHPHQLLNYMRAHDDDYDDEYEEGEENDTQQDDANRNVDNAPLVIDANPTEPTLSLIKEGIKFPTALNGSDVRVGIIMARWNADVINGLYKGVNESLIQCGVKPSNIFTTYVPGSFELPMTAKFLSASKRFDVLICLGCLIKGETMHFEYIAQATSMGIMQVALDSLTPIIFGVLTVLNKEQAIHRSTGTTNEGLSWGRSAVEMGLARMSALGMDSSQQKKKTPQPFVTFVPHHNHDQTSTDKDDKTEKSQDHDSNNGNKSNNQQTERKKFGF